MYFVCLLHFSIGRSAAGHQPAGGTNKTWSFLANSSEFLIFYVVAVSRCYGLDVRLFLFITGYVHVSIIVSRCIQGSHVSWKTWKITDSFSRSWKFYKIRKCLGKNIACETIHLEQKSPRLNIMPVEENFDCRRKRVPAHSLDIRCQLKFNYVSYIE